MEACDDGADDVLAIDRVSTEVTLTGMFLTGVSQYRLLCPFCLFCSRWSQKIFITLN